MSAREAIKAARTAGVRLGIDGDTLTLEADVAPPAAVLDSLAQHKSSIVALLREREEWRAFFDERAGIAEYDSGATRASAEARAFACCVAKWLNRNPARSSPGTCLGCGGGEHAEDKLLPFGAEPPGHAWLHSRCWPAWHAGRKAEAVAALKAMGIVPPPKFPDDFGKNGGA